MNEKMKSIGISEDIYKQLDKISKAKGMLKYRVIKEALDSMEEKYKDEILKYQEKIYE